MKAKVSITWREELVEDERNFYVKLSPDVHYQLVDVEKTKEEIADKLLKELQKMSKQVRVKK